MAIKVLQLLTATVVQVGGWDTLLRLLLHLPELKVDRHLNSRRRHLRWAEAGNRWLLSGVGLIKDLLRRPELHRLPCQVRLQLDLFPHHPEVLHPYPACLLHRLAISRGELVLSLITAFLLRRQVSNNHRNNRHCLVVI